MGEILSTKFSGKDGIVFDIVRPDRIALPSSPIIDQMLDTWNPEYYKRSRAPLHVGSIVSRHEFSQQNGLNCLDMPIKFAGSNTIRVPGEFAQFKETIEKITTYEAAINPLVASYFTYLTVDQRHVKAGGTQRVSGKHVDGIQGKNVPNKVAVEQTYIVSDTLPTTVSVQPFDFGGKSVANFNWFKIMEEQALPAHEVRGESYEIYLIDPYTVHSGTVGDIDTDRTFLRLEFSLREYDRDIDTHNPLFDYRWNKVDRSVDATLL